MTIGRAAPWQNRPSLIACWEHSGIFLDTTGVSVDVVFLAKDNLSSAQVPICIPRACRLTRVCLAYAYQTVSLENDFDLVLEQSNNCASSFAFSTQLKIPAGSPGFIMNCYCDKFDDLLFDECDVWRASMDFSAAGGIVFPFIRANFHFELR